MKAVMSLYHDLLNIVRRVYIRLFCPSERGFIREWAISDTDIANRIILDVLSKNEPCMIGRFGSSEMEALLNYIGIKFQKRNVLKYITNRQLKWWWDKDMMRHTETNTGFFPSNSENLSRFGELLLKDATQLDVLGSWLTGEKYIRHLYPNIPEIKLPLIEPFHSSNPWTRWLKNKDVVVVHPFAESIKSQYKKRELLFSNPDILPEFKSLRIIPAVQSLGGVDNGFKDWFEALEWMKSELDKHAYDIVLIGCGAYGFHLAAHAKRTGHKAVHLGGVLQLLFGIKGRRWEKVFPCEKWGMPSDSYIKFFNEYWVRPTKNETPLFADKIENACYW